MKAFKTIDSNYELDTVQSNISEVLRSIESDSPIVVGKIIDSIAIVSGTAKVVNHGLGQKLRGWIVIKKSANATIWDSQSTNDFSSLTLILNASSNVTVSLWVF